ncbi:hypothetical protein KGM_213197 [Danaus plexippus plexippus]|uniref:Uncharacterized protein n=1 Tax=Danaus plexippus plexippus TaxID=278856 RepID=A0A212FAV4_DANPL|nr:hypothetical protein KGM_213197 [Danaus plexippus plexippus]
MLPAAHFATSGWIPFGVWRNTFRLVTGTIHTYSRQDTTAGGRRGLSIRVCVARKQTPSSVTLVLKSLTLRLLLNQAILT